MIVANLVKPVIKDGEQYASAQKSIKVLIQFRTEKKYPNHVAGNACVIPKSAIVFFRRKCL
jgi:hypothetical protein